MKKTTILFLVIFITSCSVKEKVFYHGIELTAKPIPFKVYKWNTNEHEKIILKKNIHYLIKETVDNKKRVIKLEFLRRGKLSEFANFPVAKVTYEYLEDKIIETLYDKNEKTLYVDEHISHYKSIYHLRKDKFIEKVERISDFETINPMWSELDMEPPSKSELKNDLEEYNKKLYKDKSLEIEFYKYSYYKLNELYPVSKDFVIDTTKYTWKLNNVKKINGTIFADTIYIRNKIEKRIEDGVKKLTRYSSNK